MANKSCSLNSNKICSQIRKVNLYEMQKNACASTTRFRPRSMSEIQKSTMNKNKYLPTKFHYVRSLNESCLAQYFKHSIQKYVTKCRFFYQDLYFQLICVINPKSVCLGLIIKVQSIQYQMLTKIRSI